MLLFCDSADQAMRAVVLEVRRGWDLTKRRTWKLYVAQLEAELERLLVKRPRRGPPSVRDRPAGSLCGAEGT
jgi:hypothetical protein